MLKGTVSKLVHGVQDKRALRNAAIAYAKSDMYAFMEVAIKAEIENMIKQLSLEVTSDNLQDHNTCVGANRAFQDILSIPDMVLEQCNKSIKANEEK